MKDDKILVHVVENESDGMIWYIPPGGGLEFGESSIEALKREIDEELGWQIRDVCLIGSFESYHVINGMKEHEISFMYSATPMQHSDLDFIRQEVEEDNGNKKTFEWVEINTLKKSQSVLYPDGLLPNILG